MRTYYYSFLLLGCGTVYSFLNPGGSSGASQKSETSNRPSNSTVEPAVPPKDADDALNTYPQELRRQYENWDPPDEFKGTLRDDIQAALFVVATVPDPIATHLRVEFDRAIDGIKEAAADDGFLFRRYWFPWELESASQYSDWASQESEKQERARNRQSPGFLLFENRDHWSLIVLLVGESPTDGIHRRQFDMAIKLKKLIEDFEFDREIADCGRHHCEAQPVVRRRLMYVLGTSFSGSLHTLYLALRQNGDNFEAVSGTVTDRVSIDKFNSSYPGRTKSSLPLRTLTHDSVTTLTAFQQYLQNTWHYYAKRVAILSETDTVFGDLGDLQGLDSKEFFLIPFPRDIAHLRNAYQSYPELSGFGPSNLDLKQEKVLPLPLDDTRNTINSIPDFAAQTVVSQETVVSQIANRMKHEHIQFAGIIGSDVLDVLFITRFMRTASPDTRLFLIQPDLLFVHAADALPFDGVLAVTTYPLLNGNPPLEDNKDADEKHWIFPTPSQQGIHNAMRVLMGDMGLEKVTGLPGYDPVYPPDKLHNTQPALWITSVGRESFVPIAVLEMPRPGAAANPSLAALPEENGAGALSSRDPHEPTRLWWILFLMVTSAMAGLAWIFHRAQEPSPQAWLSDFHIEGGAGSRQQLTLFMVFATGIYLVVASTGIWVLVRHPADRVSFLVATVAALVGLASIGSMARIWWTRIRAKIANLLAAGVIAASVLALVVLFFFLSNNPNNLSGVFFRFRSFEVSAGAAPTIPFLFLLGGFLVYSFVSLQRRIFHHRRQSVPRAECESVLDEVWQGATRLHREFHQPFQQSRSTILLAAAAFVLCYWGFYESGIRSFEGPWYDRFFTAWASALAAALVVVCRHFLESWRQLRRMLEQLETHPVRRALSALPAEQSWSPIWQSNPRKRSYLIATRSIDCLAALQATDIYSPRLAELIDSATKCVAAILAKAAQGERETPAEAVAAQSALAEAADNLVEELQSAWRRGSYETMDGTEDAGGKHEDESPPLIYASRFVAMRYLAFIRYVMLQLRNMLTFLSLGFLAFAFALMSYPFSGERLIAWVILVLFLALSSGTIFVFAQMEMDALLKRITNRDAGTPWFGFVQRALAFGAMPLLAVLASNFNGVARLLFSWIEPTLKTLH
jgi:MFS family permease